ncbi:mechanosensitive ion channel protein MscS [Wenyingzhuangia fucanilytica]|uniref:Mechanosensitive ion channel protein MscS n=1 Tax=Wenyingzhuangia fucanilytica TaxID=1790137 RepID=A0A1B1Y4D3_9FLAO|nr:mechanosensitive ion channel family protein [Wenyingzhuangia fucanilytica]ANW95603.1 mechanosensitive ion channel protein MscS [Wenyingzhuangia fucanilytica]
MALTITNRTHQAWEQMTEKVMTWLDIMIKNLPNIAIAIVVFFLVIIASKQISKVSLKLLHKTNLQHSMKSLISKFIAVVVILFGLFLVLSILNLDKVLNTILAGVGVAGLAVGLALQGVLSNTYSGIVLSYIKQVKYGDWIKTNDYEGEIVDIDLRAITLKQIDNNLVYIPNKLVVENPIKNYSSTSQSRVILECGVGYESDLRMVKELTINTILNNFDVITNKNEVLFLWKEFGDSSINFELRFWINSTSALEVAKAKSEGIMLVKEAFKQNNINIPFPIRTLDIPKNITISNIDNSNES